MTPTPSDEVPVPVERNVCTPSAVAREAVLGLDFANTPPIDWTEYQWERFAALSPAADKGEVERMREALAWIDYHCDDQDMNHVNFRVGAGSRARAALQTKDEVHG